MKRAALSYGVLIAAPVGEPHADAVAEWLTKKGVRVAYLCAGNFMHGSMSFTPACDYGPLPHERGGDWGFDEYTIWVRRLVTNRENLGSAPNLRDLCRSESASITAGIIAALMRNPKIRVSCVDKIDCAYLAEHKLLQLEVAGRLGISFPQSLVTNDPDEARGFLDEGPAVAKGLSGNIAISPIVSRLDADLVDAVRAIPVLLQREVDAVADIRLLVCGADVIAWRRDRSTDVHPDWRREDPDGKGFFQVDPPAGLAQSAINVVSALGLSTAVQDWVLDRSGQPWFLESNPQGAWLFLPNARRVAVPMFANHLIYARE
ncbi:ATP-grasp domain-containing protein [Micromonospora violae]|uniref:ATP-grasp domain-containing protein n=1 Tax=Micromonospora violae TaxID=1278207 RepID=UPI0033DA6094